MMTTTNRDRAMAARHILFSIEILLAAALTLLLMTRPLTSYWTCGIFSTLAGLWVIKALKNKSEGSKGYEELWLSNEHDDALMLYEHRHHTKMRSRFKAQPRKVPLADGDEGHGGRNENIPMPSKVITDTESFLSSLDTADDDEFILISFPLLAVLVTAVLRCAVSFLVTVHNTRRIFRRRGQSSRSSRISFSHIPFTTMRRMPSNWSFSQILFSLSNYFWHRGPHEYNDSMELRAVSFDYLSIGSSHFIINSHPASNSQSSRLGMSFDDLQFAMTIFFQCQYVTIQLKVGAFKFGLFPCCFNWCEGIGIKIDVKATFGLCGASDKHSSMPDFGMAVRSNRLRFDRFSAHFTPTDEGRFGACYRGGGRCISWDKIDSSFHLHRHRNGFSSDSREKGVARKETVSLAAFPSGFVVSYDTCVHMKLGGCLCGHRLALGFNLRDSKTFIQIVEQLVDKLSSSIVTKCTERIGASASQVNSRAKGEVLVNLFELSVVTSFHSYVYGNTKSLHLDYFSFIWSMNVHSLFQATENIKQKDGAQSPLILADMGDATVKYESFSDYRLDDSCMVATNLVLMKQIKGKLMHESDRPAHELNCVISCGRLFVRADGQTVNKLACMMGEWEGTKLAAANLQCSANKLRHEKAVNQNSAGASSRKREQIILHQLELSFESFDTIIEFLEGDVVNSGRVRFALLQEGAFVRLLRKGRRKENPSISSGGTEVGADLPDQLFGREIQALAQHHFVQANIVCFESSVTFCSHSSLPTLEALSKSRETSFYLQSPKLVAKLIIPLNYGGTISETNFLSKAASLSFNQVNLFERFDKKLGTGPSLLSISVHEFFFPKSIIWPMEQKFAFYKAAELVRIAKLKGKFCLVEKRNNVTDERMVSISILFSKTSTDLELVWSPLINWMQVSCNKRIQAALSALKNRASISIPAKKSSSVTMKIYIDSSTVTTNLYLYIGTKTVARVVVLGGTLTHISKTMTPKNEPKSTGKPNVSFQAKHIHVYFNDILHPVLAFEQVSFGHYFRKANDKEINEYANKDGSDRAKECSDRPLCDVDGDPLKEIFELKGSALAKFPPVLHFGEIIEDFILMPKSLRFGLDQLKGEQKRMQRKLCNLMSVKCLIPFLDVSLMGSYSKSTPSRPSGDVLSNDFPIFRVCFEDTEADLQRNAPPELIQSHIRALDEDDTCCYSYGPVIQGGLLSLSIKHVLCTLQPLNLSTPLVCIDEFAFNGYIYLAGLSPATLEIQKGKKDTPMILCHHNRIVMNQGVLDRKHWNCCCSYVVPLYSTGIPLKLYTDSKITCGRLCIAYMQGVKKSELKECIQRLLPPKPDSEAQLRPLPWWDNVRFFVHGSISISADKLSFRWLLDSHINRDQSIIFSCLDCAISHVVGSFEIEIGEILVSVPGTAYDMSVHPSDQPNMGSAISTFCLPNEAESVVGNSRHSLIYVPSFKAIIKFVWKMLQPGQLSSRHHSVYTKEKTSTDSDGQERWLSHRTDGINVDCDFELLGSNICDNWIAARIDVLPWLTHLSSTLSHRMQPVDDDTEPFPTIQSMGIRVRTSKCRVATWFKDEGDLDGLCFIVNQVSYNGSSDGSKIVVIDGPVKAAIFDVSKIKNTENVVRDNDKSSEIMMGIEEIAVNFGAAERDHSTVSNMPSEAEAESVSRSHPFLELQTLSCNIVELDYVVVVTGQINICNQPSKILSGSEQLCAGATRKSLGTTWSILVCRLKLLWTIAIRDSLTAITKDLIYTIGYMKSQHRQLQVLSGKSQQNHEARAQHSASFEEGFELSLNDPPLQDTALNKSMLEYLLESFDEDLASPVEKATDEGHTSAHDVLAAKKVMTLPTLDIHFSNPQVQLHSTATGGSIILAAEEAHVEGRKFVHFLAIKPEIRSGKISPSDLLRKTEYMYRLTNMGAYSLSTNVDLDVGLQWLDVASSPVHCQGHEALDLEERFDIDDSVYDDMPCRATASQQLEDGCHKSTSSPDNAYPLHLQHHQPLPFSTSGLLSEILNPFTFTLKSIFHRPPIHYSRRELFEFIEQGMVIEQDEAAVDDIKLQIDLLDFNLDSNQFKTTLDVIRNVLLEPPKPHQRHESHDQDNSETQHISIRHIRNDVTTEEMEEVLRQPNQHKVGKKGREIQRKAAMRLLQDVEDRIALHGNGVFRRVSYKLSKLQWCIESQDEIDDVQIAFTGFLGQHDYLRNGSIFSELTLEDIHVSSSRPGPDSLASFQDASSIVNSVLGSERSPCQRCGQYFDHSNDLDSCRFHTGEYELGVWTCCNSSDKAAPGCKSGPHTGKELAAVVRVETLPRILEGLSLYRHLEVNLFPGILHTLVFQVSKSMSRLFMRYFFCGDGDGDGFEAFSATDDATETIDTNQLCSESLKPIIRKRTAGNQETIDNFENQSEFKFSIEDGKKFEIAFIKVWRIGYVDVNVSLGGFTKHPLKSLGISVPAYSKAYEIGTWEDHGRKYLWYLVQEIFKSGASSGIDKFRRKVMGNSLDQSDSQPEITESGITPKPTTSVSTPAVFESFIGRHLRRPMGAADILGTPAKKSAKRKKKTK